MKASRIAAAGAVSGIAVLALSAPAFAHVSVQPAGTAAKGGYATVGFKVPNERDNASTTKLEINFPADHPLASVMPQPVPGWKAEVTKSKLDKPLESHGKQLTEVVTKVTWTAEGKGIEPGYFQKFPVSLGALPENTDQLVFKAIQTYSDKEVVRWIEVPQEGQEEPDTGLRPRTDRRRGRRPRRVGRQGRRRHRGGRAEHGRRLRRVRLRLGRQQ
ncbi:hypothetical protein SALBM217S_02467 [Streptomyces griseoloalbus]